MAHYFGHFLPGFILEVFEISFRSDLYVNPLTLSHKCTVESHSQSIQHIQFWRCRLLQCIEMYTLRDTHSWAQFQIDGGADYFADNNGIFEDEQDEEDGQDEPRDN